MILSSLELKIEYSLIIRGRLSLCGEAAFVYETEMRLEKTHYKRYNDAMLMKGECKWIFQKQSKGYAKHAI